MSVSNVVLGHINKLSMSAAKLNLVPGIGEMRRGSGMVWSVQGFGEPLNCAPVAPSDVQFLTGTSPCQV